MGIHLRGRSSATGWRGRRSPRAIVLEVKRFILSDKVVQSDDTHVQVRMEDVRMERGFLWAYAIPWAEVVYDFSLSRGQGTPAKFLEGYHGYLQADGYEGYKRGLPQRSRPPHRMHGPPPRKFLRRPHEAPDETRVVLVAIQRLYRIEREAKEAGLDPAARREKRQAEALPSSRKLEGIIRDYGSHALPKSEFGGAVTYALNQWPDILRTRRSARRRSTTTRSRTPCGSPSWAGRTGSSWEAPRAAASEPSVLYSLIASCKRLGVEPFAYLRDVLERVSTHPSSRIWS